MIDKFLDELHPVLLLLLAIGYGFLVFGLSWVWYKFDCRYCKQERNKYYKRKYGIEWDDYLAQHTGGNKENTLKK